MALRFLYSPTLTSIHDYWKNQALTLGTVVRKVMSLLFNTLSSLVIAFFPRRKCLIISWLQLPSAVIWCPQNKVCQCFHCVPIYLPWSDGTGCHDLSFLNVELFKPTSSLSSFTFIKRLLLLGKKVMTNLDSILKSRDVTLPTKIHLVKAWFFQ